MSSLYLLDPLCCLEDHQQLEEEEEEGEQQQLEQEPHLDKIDHFNYSASTWMMGDGLQSLLAKQAETHELCQASGYPKAEPFLTWARREATDWIVRASGYLGFTPQTTILAVDYLDRFFSNQKKLKERQPWMAQLSAVACLSIAAKVEETHVPLLLDLQVEGSRFVFEAKTVQRMELLVLSTLGWRMYSVTPVSLIDNLVRRIGLSASGGRTSEFQMRCYSALLSAVSDLRWVEFLPSILAASTILLCLSEFDLLHYKDQFLSLLDTTVENVLDCSQFITEAIASGGDFAARSKRAPWWSSAPASPTGVLSSSFSYESSNDSCEIADCASLKRRKI